MAVAQRQKFIYPQAHTGHLYSFHSQFSLFHGYHQTKSLYSLNECNLLLHQILVNVTITKIHVKVLPRDVRDTVPLQLRLQLRTVDGGSTLVFGVDQVQRS